MYNSFSYNENLYNKLNKTSSNQSESGRDIIAFNGYNFSDIIISNIPDDYAGNSLSIETYQLSTHGQGLGNRLIKSKSLSINGRIVAENQLQLEEKIKRIKTNLLQGQSVLYLKRASEILQTNAVVTSFSVPRENWTINAIEIRIVFSILDPFFYSVQKHELAYYGITTDFYTSIFYETGSHSAKAGIFIMFGTNTSCNEINIHIGEKTVKVKETFTAGDILYLDGEKVDIAKNGRYGIDWIGEIGELNFGENSIVINCNGVANYSVFIQYRDTYV